MTRPGVTHSNASKSWTPSRTVQFWHESDLQVREGDGELWFRRLIRRFPWRNRLQTQAFASCGRSTPREPGEALEAIIKAPHGPHLSMDTQFYELRRHPVLRSVALHERHDFRGGEHAPHP